jgi:hypothetical protein
MVLRALALPITWAAIHSRFLCDGIICTRPRVSWLLGQQSLRGSGILGQGEILPSHGSKEHELRRRDTSVARACVCSAASLRCAGNWTATGSRTASSPRIESKNSSWDFSILLPDYGDLLNSSITQRVRQASTTAATCLGIEYGSLVTSFQSTGDSPVGGCLSKACTQSRVAQNALGQPGAIGGFRNGSRAPREMANVLCGAFQSSRHHPSRPTIWQPSDALTE